MASPSANPARLARRLLTPVLALTATAGFAQLIPNAPIPDFHLPVFDAVTERKVSDLRGATAIYHSRSLIELRDFTLVMFQPDGSQGLEVQSPKAMLHLPEKTAANAMRFVDGDQSIRVRSPDYALTGRNWRFEEKDKDKKDYHIVVRQDVRVTINAAIGSILK